MDDKIENNEKIITNLEKLQLQTFKDYEASENDSKEFKLSDFIKFIKGKKPNENKNNLMNYLNIEGITTNNFSKKCARDMILADSEDILMVMDGASSGTIFIGNIGIVSSTLAKLEINCEEYRYLIFEKLKVMEKKIKELNTGSAIPHANKDFINSIKLKINCKSEFVNNNLKELNNLIIKIKYENIKFNKLKQLYLKKFFG